MAAVERKLGEILELLAPENDDKKQTAQDEITLAEQQRDAGVAGLQDYRADL